MRRAGGIRPLPQGRRLRYVTPASSMERKRLVIGSILTSVLLFSVFVILYYLYEVIWLKPRLDVNVLIDYAFSVLVTTLLFILRFKNRYIKHFETVTHAMYGTLILGSTYLVYMDGITSTGGLLIAIIVIIASTITHSRAFSRTLLVIMATMFIVVYAFKLWAGVSYIQEPTDSHIVNTIMMLGLVFLIARIVHLGFTEMETSYELANKYAMELTATKRTLTQEKVWRKRYLARLLDEMGTMASNSLLTSIATPMIHDLATPISVIEGEMINKSIKNTKIQQAVRTIKSMIINTKEMLAGKHNRVAFDASNMTASTLELMQSLFDYHKIYLQIHIKRGITLHGSPVLYQRAIANLLLNSIEAHLQESEYTGQPIIEVVLQQQGSKAILEINDNAIGISPDRLKRIRQASASLANKESGLGLKSVHRTVTKHFGGEFKIQSKLSVGTAIKILFPLA